MTTIMHNDGDEDCLDVTIPHLPPTVDSLDLLANLTFFLPYSETFKHHISFIAAHEHALVPQVGF